MYNIFINFEKKKGEIVLMRKENGLSIIALKENY